MLRCIKYTNKKTGKRDYIRFKDGRKKYFESYEIALHHKPKYGIRVRIIKA